MQTEIEQLTQERDNLQRRLRELESQQQTLSSENSKYRSELQKMAGEMGATSRPRNAGPWDASPGHTPGPWG